MRLRNALVLCAAALVVVTCGRLGQNWIAVQDKASIPVEIGRIQSSLWVEYGWEGEEGAGQAFLVMSDGEIDCDELEDQLTGSYSFLYSYDEDIFYGDANGVLGLFTWWHSDDEDAGFEGLYSAGGYAYSDEGDLERRMLPLVFGDGVLWYSYYGTPGVAEVSEYTDDLVIGSIRTSTLDADFSAENCGLVSGNGYDYYYDDDDEYYYDSGR